MENKKYFNVEESDLRSEESKTEEEAFLQKLSKEIHRNINRKNRPQEFYKNGSCAILKGKNNAAKFLQKKASKSYNISAFWQYNRNLSLISQANT